MRNAIVLLAAIFAVGCNGEADRWIRDYDAYWTVVDRLARHTEELRKKGCPLSSDQLRIMAGESDVSTTFSRLDRVIANACPSVDQSEALASGIWIKEKAMLDFLNDMSKKRALNDAPEYDERVKDLLVHVYAGRGKFQRPYAITVGLLGTVRTDANSATCFFEDNGIIIWSDRIPWLDQGCERSGRPE